MECDIRWIERIIDQLLACRYITPEEAWRMREYLRGE